MLGHVASSRRRKDARGIVGGVIRKGREWARRRSPLELFTVGVAGFAVLFVAVGTLLIAAGGVMTITMTNEAHAQELFGLLKCASDIFDKHDFPYFLEAGTLLGAVRENQIIVFVP